MAGLFLKYLLGDLRITQVEMGRAIKKPDGSGYGKTLMNFVCNGKWDRFPADPKFKAKVQDWLLGKPGVREYLAKKGMTIEGIWHEVKNGGPVKAGGRRKDEARKREAAARAAEGSEQIELLEEVEMLSFEARKHFRLAVDPFRQEVQSREDIFLSDEHRYMFYAMKDAAENGGFMAIVGEVGSGKSIARKWLEEELAKDDTTQIIAPCALDRGRLTDASLLDAVIMDLSHEAPKCGPEKKARQVRRLLLDRSRDDYKVALIVEDAQGLTVKAFKVLKRLYEIEDGYKKTLGIVLIGQPELGALLNEREHPEMREVIRRCQVAEIMGLNGNMRQYLDHKFRKASTPRAKIITDEAIEALGRKLTVKGPRGKDISYAYPLTVNNYVVKAMNMAVEMGFKLVTEEIVNAI